ILPTTFSSGISGIIMNQFLSNRINCVPKVITERCKLCQICIEHCPVDAMQISEDFPYANRDKCISCYCCQELCPEDAIILPGRLLEIIRRRSRKKR
ncbi:MAG: 4Fe-4S binding protein, partial [Spirochaetota bacterium]|nr:4Fe-4S binding protein [Spirochaetota bacterium]